MQQTGLAIRAMALKSGVSEFKFHPVRKLDLVTLVISSNPRSRLKIANCFAAGQLEMFFLS